MQERCCPLASILDPDLGPFAHSAAGGLPMRTGTLPLLWRDIRNYVQAQIAVRIPSVYCPSLFGHYGVNSTCNLRCSYCYVHEPETYPKGFSEHGLPLDQARRV